VFFLALYFSLVYLTHLVKFCLDVSVNARGELVAGQMLLPAFLWAAFFVLVNWP
jgi:hypothetical protein